MALYESEHTRYIRELMEKHPGLAERQREGRALWWDRPADAEEQRRFAAARVAQKPYVYSSFDMARTE